MMYLHLILMFGVLMLNRGHGKHIEKRQLFREQVLPHMGGKVPESAFWSDRLALNQLNARGIYSSTGTYLEHRQNKQHQHVHERVAHPTMQVRAPAEDRFVAAAGRYYNSPQTLDTTYVIRDPVASPIKSNILHQTETFIPYTSLKLMRFYHQKKHEKNSNSPWNEVNTKDDFSLQVKKEFAPYLKKLHEVD